MIIIPAKLEHCVTKVEKTSPKVNPWAVCQTSLKGEEMVNDMLVYPKEFKMGMKEELEHQDVIGDDKEALKKIVLAHLKEDPHYYSKLSAAFAAEEDSIIPYKKPEGTKLPKDSRSPKHEIDSLMHLTQKKAEEEAYHPGESFIHKEPMEHYILRPKGKLHSKDVQITYKDPKKLHAGETKILKKGEEEIKDILGRGKPGGNTLADTHALNVYKDKLSTKLGKPTRPPLEHIAEEEVKSNVSYIKKAYIDSPIHQTKFRESESEPKLPNAIKIAPVPKKAEEEGIMDKIKSTVKDLTSSPKPTPYKTPTPITKSFTRKLQQRANEECDKKLSTQLLEKAEEELGTDKVEEKKNQTIVENFSKPKQAEEEMDKPAVFKAPEETK